MKQYDIIVIGSGAGLIVMESAIAMGLSVAIVERSKFGGTCLNRGCIPSKMLVYPADMIREAALAPRVGVHLGTPAADWDVISQRMWAQIHHSEQLAQNLRDFPGVDVYEANAEFADPHTLRLTFPAPQADALIAAKRIVVAAGARSFVPPIPGLAETGYVTSETFFGALFPKAPWKRLIIIGGGAIGAEFAHIFSAFGSKVTVVEMRQRLIATEEEEISHFVEKQFVHNGIEVLTNHKILSASKQNGEKVLLVQDTATGQTRSIPTDEIFIASGVRSNSDQLHCEVAGIAMDEKGWIITNEYLETSQDHIFAIGDINGLYQFRHKANYEAGLLSHNLLSGGEKRAACYNAVPWAIFTWPQVGHVGLTEQEAKQQGLKVRTAVNYYSNVVAGIAMGFSQQDEDNGFVKIIIGEDKRILGAHVVGPHAAVLVQPFVYLMNAGLSCDLAQPPDAERPLQRERRLIRRNCISTGTVMPIMNSMVIHPSFNELTAWALENVDWNDEQ